MPDTAAVMARDARLGDPLRPPADPSAELGRPRRILLTGVTGFLGGQLAAELLRATDARLWCVVRARPDADPRDRLADACRRNGLDASRVALVPSDDPGGGIAAALADPALRGRIDTVVHCAAQVNLFAPYPALRDANVRGARAVLHFAANGAPKAVHHVSTTGVFLSPHYRRGTVFEDEPLQGEDGLRNGYTQSKWAADTMMARARERGFRVTVYRPAFVGWHSRTGRPGEHDLVALLLRASWAAGCAPPLDLQINSSPVDTVARTVAGVVGCPGAWNATYHVVNRGAVRFVDLAALAGLPVVSFPQWTLAVRRRAPRLARFAAMVEAAQGDERSGAEELAFRYDRTYDDKRLRAVLGSRRPRPVPLDADYLCRLFAWPPDGAAPRHGEAWGRACPLPATAAS